MATTHLAQTPPRFVTYVAFVLKNPEGNPKPYKVLIHDAPEGELNPIKVDLSPNLLGFMEFGQYEVSFAGTDGRQILLYDHSPVPLSPLFTIGGARWNPSSTFCEWPESCPHDGLNLLAMLDPFQRSRYFKDSLLGSTIDLSRPQ